MKKQILIETNPYLRDPATRRKLIARSVQTSCAVEGILVKEEVVKLPQKTQKRIFLTGMLSKRSR